MTKSKHKTTADRINLFIDGIFSIISTVASNIGSNVAPLTVGIIPATITWINIMAIWNNLFMAWAGAITIEFLGLGASGELMHVWKHNKVYATKTGKNDMPWLAPGLAGGWYIAVMVIFNVMLDVWPNSGLVQVLSVALFSTLAVPGYALHSAKTLREEWERERFRAGSTSSNKGSESKEEQDGAESDDSLPAPEPASQWLEHIRAIMQDALDKRVEIPTPKQIALQLNTQVGKVGPLGYEGYGANVDVRKASGYISTKRREFMLENDLLLEDNNG